jgi:hypothetical protein
MTRHLAGPRQAKIKTTMLILPLMNLNCGWMAGKLRRNDVTERKRYLHKRKVSEHQRAYPEKPGFPFKPDGFLTAKLNTFMLNTNAPSLINQTSKFSVSSPHYRTFVCFIGLV